MVDSFFSNYTGYSSGTIRPFGHKLEFEQLTIRYLGHKLEFEQLQIKIIRGTVMCNVLKFRYVRLFYSYLLSISQTLGVCLTSL